ncbi:uncharacterized protein LOC117780860 [Drosophila innubila]|uniref:uncharacterized protein LOC117780860 n=1 Tax=Drosophila innubila TaxID=198719 RepID=UPI00148D3691|nr:uncharacterized protein LOC117780860 [Drosophila innubila]
MFQRNNNNFKNKFKREIQDRSKSWGKTKFKPKPFVRTTSAPAPVPETAKPWQHVKNDILDDEEELRSSDRFNMDSQQAKDILKQREQNHRRNIIEAKRNEKTTWESFDDGDNAAPSASSKPKANKDDGKSEPFSVVKTKNPEHLNPWERNFVRKKLTKMVGRKYKSTNLQDIITDMKKNNLVKPQNFKKFRDEKKN